MSVPEIGQPAPELVLPDQTGQDFELASLKGTSGALLVFYPFAFSGLCTGELTELRDEQAAFVDANVQVAAISCDPRYSLRAWSDQERYDFPLLSDFWPHGEAAQRYGVFDESAGKSVRGSFLVDREGVLRWSVVNGPGQARDMAEYKAAVAAL